MAPRMTPKFRNRETQRVYEGRFVKRFSGIARQAERRLSVVVLAASLSDLSASPGMRLEPLRGDRAGQHSVRVNDQYRICFEWVDGKAINIELTDYHS